MAAVNPVKFKPIIKKVDETTEEAQAFLALLSDDKYFGEPLVTQTFSLVIDMLEKIYIAVGETNVAINLLVNSDDQNKYLKMKDELSYLGVKFKDICRRLQLT